MEKKKCIYCKRIFQKKQCESSKFWSTRKYCSLKCYWQNIKGKSFINSGQFKKGNVPWSKGRNYRSLKNSKTKKEMYKNKENHPHYGKFKKNPSYSYSNIHKWLYARFGKAIKCENKRCKGKSNTFVWANISGKYKRERNDFLMLCQSCHMKADKNGGIKNSNVLYC